MTAASPRFLLAVEGGGSKTTALLTDLDGKNVGRGFGPGSNPHSVGFESAQKAVAMAIDGALINATGRLPEGSSWRETGLAAACFGLAGIDGPEDEAQLTAWVRTEAIAERFVVVNDSELVVAAGTPDGWGVALISGAGSVCLGRSPQGRTVRVGGWGHLLGDEGSGYRMALEALRLAVVGALDGDLEVLDVVASPRHEPIEVRDEIAQLLVHYADAYGDELASLMRRAGPRRGAGRRTGAGRDRR